MATNIFYDKEFRTKIRNSDQESLAQLMESSQKNARIKVITNTKDTFYFVIPEVDNEVYDLQSVQAAGYTTTARCYATAGSIGCASSTISSMFSASTAGSK